MSRARTPAWEQTMEGQACGMPRAVCAIERARPRTLGWETIATIGGRGLWASVAMGLALGACAAGARGQSFNVDMDITSGAGANVPTQTFGAAAGTPGRWNSVPATGTGPFRLLLLNGATSTVTVTRVGLAAGFGTNNTATSGEFERLLDDIQNIGNPTPTNNTGSTLTIDGLAPGDYELWTYAIAPDSSVLRSVVTVTPSEDPAQTVGGTMPTNAFALGVTHARHRFSIPGEGASVALNVKGGSASPGSINGFQIKQIKPGRLYVQSGVAAGGDGRAWGSALNDLSSALAQWSSMDGFAAGAGVPEIWISRGTYLTSSSADRSASFVLPAGGRLIGNFRGTSFGNGGETLRSQRAPGLPAGTILSGDIGTPAFDADNAWAVLRCAGSAVLDAVTIEGARGDGPRGDLCGGVVCAGETSMLGVTVRRSSSKFSGGGVRAIGAGRVSIEGGLLEDCSADVGGAAVGGLDERGEVRLASTRVLRSRGGADGSAVRASGSVDVINTVIAGSVVGGACVQGGGRVRVVNSTLFANTLGVGGAVRGGANSAIANSVVWRCTTEDGQEQPAAGNGVGVTWSVCAVPVQGQGNSSQPPRFRNPAGADGQVGTTDDDYAPMWGSPALDSGDFDAWTASTANTTVDASGGVRVVAVVGGSTPALDKPPIDRGAVEAAARVCSADFNSSGGVSVEDVFAFLSQWFTGQIRADMNESGQVDVGDLFTFLQRWFEGC